MDTEQRLWAAFETRYTRGGLIGEGGEGSVYYCTERVSDSVYVVKYTKRPSTLMGGIKEEKILRDILGPRPNFVHCATSLFDRPSGTGMLILEFCDGNSLQNLIANYATRDGYVPEAFVWHVFKQVAGALEYVHRRGVFHRDLKPDNILLSWIDPRWGNRYRHQDYPHVKVADFGLAGVLSDPNYSPIDHSGTAAFQPPEIPLATAPGDIWALGATVYHTMAFRVPLPRRHRRWDTLAKAKCDPEGPYKEPYIFPTVAYGRNIWSFVEKALSFAAEDRPSAAQLYRALNFERPYQHDSDFETLASWATTLRSQSRR